MSDLKKEVREHYTINIVSVEYSMIDNRYLYILYEQRSKELRDCYFKVIDLNKDDFPCELEFKLNELVPKQ